jgi:hypothetical protein
MNGLSSCCDPIHALFQFFQHIHGAVYICQNIYIRYNIETRPTSTIYSIIFRYYFVVLSFSIHTLLVFGEYLSINPQKIDKYKLGIYNLFVRIYSISDFHRTPCVSENVRVRKAISLPAIVQRRCETPHFGARFSLRFCYTGSE